MLAHASNPWVISEMLTWLKLFTGMRLCMTALSSGNIKISASEVLSTGSNWGSLTICCKTNCMTYPAQHTPSVKQNCTAVD